MIPSNLGQIIGRLMLKADESEVSLGEQPPAPAPIPSGRRTPARDAILVLLAAQGAPTTAPLIAERCGMSIANACVTLGDMVNLKLILRTGERGRFLYALPGKP